MLNGIISNIKYINIPILQYVVVIEKALFRVSNVPLPKLTKRLRKLVRAATYEMHTATPSAIVLSYTYSRTTNHRPTHNYLKSECMDKHIKNGMISMCIWIIFLVILFGSYLYLTDAPFTYFIDKETGGFISGSFFLAWALIWFGIGRHYSIDYESKKRVFLQKFQDVDENIVLNAFRKAYFSNIARMLSMVFFVAVPFYVAANVRDTVTLKNCISIGILMILSIITYLFYKKNHIEDIKF